MKLIIPLFLLSADQYSFQIKFDREGLKILDFYVRNYGSMVNPSTNCVIYIIQSFRIKAKLSEMLLALTTWKIPLLMTFLFTKLHL